MPRQRYRSISGGSLSDLLPKSPAQSTSSASCKDYRLLFDIWTDLKGQEGKSIFHCNQNCNSKLFGVMKMIIHLASLIDRDRNITEDFDRYSHPGRERKNSNASEGMAPSKNTTINANKKCVSMLEKLLLSSENESGYTPLHKAIINQDLLMVLKILRHAVIDVQDQQLFYEYKGHGRFSYRPIKMLQGDVNNALLEKIVSTKDNEGFTPLNLLCNLQRTDLEKCRRSISTNRHFNIGHSSSSNAGREYDEFDFELEEDNEFHILHTLNNESFNQQSTNNERKKLNENDYGCEVFTFGRANHCALGVFRSSDSSAADHQHTINVNTIKKSSPRIQRVRAFGLADVGIDKSAVAIAAASHHTLVATKNGQLFSFGLGKGGRLGVGDERNQPLPIRILGPIAKRFVISIAAAENHSLCVTKDGNVYAWGSNRFGQLGLISNGNKSKKVDQITSNNQRFVPRKVDSLKDVFCTSVAAGSRHSIALSRKGEVYCWGDNQAGQLGCSFRSGAGIEATQEAVRVNALWEANPKKIAISISTSDQSTMVLTCSPKSESLVTKNAIYTWGHGNQTPTRVHFSNPHDGASSLELAHINPVAIACAKHHNVAVMSDGRVFTWGLHTDHLGIPLHVKKKMKDSRSMIIASPHLVTGMLPENGGGEVVAVSASDSHTAVLTTCGQLYTWGVNDSKNNLGHEGVRFQPIPKKVPGVFRAVNVAVAKEHTVLLVGTSFPSIDNSIRNGNSELTLENIAAKSVARHIDLFNIIPVLVTAERIHCKNLIDYCKKFISLNLDGILTVGRKSEMDCYLNEHLQDNFQNIDDMARDESFHPMILDLLKLVNIEAFSDGISSKVLWEHDSDELEKILPSVLLSKFQTRCSNGKDLKHALRRRSLSFNFDNDTTSRSGLVSFDETEINRSKKISSTILPQKFVPQMNRAQECSERCIMLTSDLNLKTIDAIETKYAYLTKETRGIRKKLNQVEKLQAKHENSPSSLSSDEIEKLHKRPLFEADIAALERALSRLKELKRLFTMNKPQALNGEAKEIGVHTTQSICIVKHEDKDEIRTMPEAAAILQFRCEICNISCPDKTSYMLHYNGRKHINRIKQIKDKEKQDMADAMMQKKQIELMMNGPTVITAQNHHRNPWKCKDGSGSLPTYNLKPPQSGEKNTHRSAEKLKKVQPKWFHDVIPSPVKNSTFGEILEDERKKSSASKARKIAQFKKGILITPQSNQTTGRSKAYLHHATPIKNPDNSNIYKSDLCCSPKVTSSTPVESNSRRDLWLGDFVSGPRKSPISTRSPGWNAHSPTKVQGTPQKSILEIQGEEEALRNNQDNTFSLDSKWFVERRERAGSLSFIQDEAEKERELEILVTEQKKIEQQIQSQIQKEMDQKKRNRKKNPQPKNFSKRKSSKGKSQQVNSKNEDCNTKLKGKCVNSIVSGKKKITRRPKKTKPKQDGK